MRCTCKSLGVQSHAVLDWIDPESFRLFCPGMAYLGQAVLNSIGVAQPIKRNSPISFCSPAYGKLDTVVSEDGMDCVEHRFKQTGKEITSNQARRSWMQFGVGKFEVLSMATNRYKRPSSVCTSAISIWKYPIG